VTRQQRTFLIAIAASLALAGGALATTAAAASPKAGASARCRTSQLRLSLARTLGAAGRRDWDLALRNVGTRTCTLRGYPTVQLVNRQGHRIQPQTIDNDLFATRTVTLHPGQRAFFTFVFESAGPCVPHGFTAAGLAVFPPGAIRRLLLHRQLAVCDAKLGGDPTTSSIRAGVGYIAADSSGERARAERTPACIVANLRARAAGLRAAAGHMIAEFSLANHGPAACTLRGYPRVQMLDAHGGAWPPSTTTCRRAPKASS
jgi:Protein of unknown function (DUF4232)